ncbi:MAG: hypothetical protein HY874_01985, partial [Chloroflexi bacterium]|nr:hypothetical protein [Chloroflexota bacterium]
MLRMSFALFAVALSAAMVACSGDERATPSATPPAPAATREPLVLPEPDAPTASPPRPTATPDVAVGPAVAAAEALSEESFRELHRYFVIDLGSGLVQPLGRDAAFSSSDPIAWLDDDTLWLGHPDGPLMLDVDGSVRVAVALGPPPENQATYRGGESHNGAW